MSTRIRAGAAFASVLQSDPTAKEAAYRLELLGRCLSPSCRDLSDADELRPMLADLEAEILATEADIDKRRSDFAQRLRDEGLWADPLECLDDWEMLAEVIGIPPSEFEKLTLDVIYRKVIVALNLRRWNAQSQTPRLTVNEQLHLLLQKEQALLIGMSSRQLAKRLGCSHTAIEKTDAWGTIKYLRALERNERRGE